LPRFLSRRFQRRAHGSFRHLQPESHGARRSLTAGEQISMLPAMSTGQPKGKPQFSERGREAAADRQERLAAALRDNLRKRKQQARERKAEVGREATPEK